MAKDKRRTKSGWWELGADAAYRVLEFEDPPHHRRVYMCPLCGRFHPRECIDNGELTLEHVPPDSIGGRALVLTCARCNNGAGTDLDWHAADELKAREVLSFTRGESRITLDGEVNGLLRIPDPKSLHFVVDRQRSNPVAFDDFFARLERRLTTASRSLERPSPLFSFWVPTRHDNRRANLSYLRSGYLMAFALFGYRLVLGRSYLPVRRQLRHIGEPIIPRLPIGIAAPQQPRLFAGRLEGVGDALVARFNDLWVGLPGYTEDIEWWDRLAVAPRSARLAVRVVHNVPKHPMHVSDMMPLPPQGRSWRQLDFFGDRRLAA